MSVARSAQCLFGRQFAPRTVPLFQHRELHASAALLSKRRPRFKSLSESEVRRRLKAPENANVDDLIRPYTSEEMEALSKKYTPQQLAAIQAGEEAIDPKDLLTQAVPRHDPYMIPYLEDFSTFRPILDRTQTPKVTPYDPEARLAQNESEVEKFRAQSQEKISRFLAKRRDQEDQASSGSSAGGLAVDQEFIDLENFLSDKPEVPVNPSDAVFPTRKSYAKKVDKAAATRGEPAITTEGFPEPKFEELFGASEASKGLKGLEAEVPTSWPVDAMSPDLPVIPELEGKFKPETDDPSRDPTGAYGRLAKMTGRSLDEIVKCTSKILFVNRVTNQTRLGKIHSVYCLAIAGNGDGLLGIGEGKSVEPADASSKARLMAIRNMKPIPRYEGRTIFGDQHKKLSSVNVHLFAKPPGYGLRCQHLIYELARLAGISDLGARVPDGRNKMNTVKAAYEALLNQKLPEDIARGRGKKMVDVRKVYYGGAHFKLPGAGRTLGAGDAGEFSKASNAV